MIALRVGRFGARGFGRHWPCAIGRGGISHQKVEGDGASPAGVWTITGCFYRADRLASPAPWARAIGPRDLWCDEDGHPDYNLPVRAPFSGGHEVLRRADPLYDIVLTTDWNWPLPAAGKGSAIFIHQWRRPRYPTAGCVAFTRSDLGELARLLAPGSQIVVGA